VEGIARSVNTFLTILLVTAMVGTLVVLALGVVQMVRGGDDAKRSNTLMQYRVVFQGVALLVFLGLLMLLKG